MKRSNRETASTSPPPIATPVSAEKLKPKCITFYVDHHFPSEKALAQYLVHLWSAALVEVLSQVTSTGEPSGRQVASIQRSLATVVAQNRIARAGMLLSLEQAVVDCSLKGGAAASLLRDALPYRQSW